MSLYIKDDPSLTQDHREAFEAHLLTCPACAEVYQDDKQLVALLKRDWPISESTKKLLRDGGYGAVEDGRAKGTPSRPMTAAQGWEDLKRRCPSLAQACRRQERKKKLHKLAWHIGGLAAAACLLIAVGVGWLALRGNSGQSISGLSANAGGSSAAAFAELVTAQGRRPLALNQPVRTADEPQEILLGGMHRVVVNRDTTATFAATPALARDGSASIADQEAKVPYEIQLGQGELYVEVVPGHPFTVRTSNARLDITGTKFDVRVRGDKTQLVLLKGSVRFSQRAVPSSFVDVTAGHAATISGRSAPTAPREVDALAATAWARELAVTNALASVQPDAELHLLDFIRDYWPQPKPVDLDSIDYVKWRDEHRDWFARQFPWTFEAQRVLKDQHGIEADYVELLMVCGDIWQFHFPRPLGQPIPIFDPSAIGRIAEHYRIEDDRLLKAVWSSPLTSQVANEVSPTTGEGGVHPVEAWLAAQRDWQSALVSAAADPDGLSLDLLLFNLHAGTYLVNTRTAAYMWIKKNPERFESLQLTDQYMAMLPAILRSIPCNSWNECADAQIKALHGMAEVAARLILVPDTETSQCNGASAELTGQLLGFVSMLNETCGREIADGEPPHQHQE